MNKNLGAVAAAAVVHSEAEGLVKTINIIRGLSCLAALVGIATSIATAELYFDNLYESTALTDSFKLVTSITTAFLIALICTRHAYQFKLQHVGYSLPYIHRSAVERSRWLSAEIWR